MVAKADILAIINVTIVPYGNAMTSSTGKVTCQHGPQECWANKMEACVIDAYPKFTDHFPMIDCVEGANELTNTTAEACAKKHKISWATVEKCIDGPRGDELIKLAGAKTNSLKPPHQFTPWVVVDGKPMSDPTKLLSTICAAYTGEKPESCSSFDDFGGPIKPCMADN